MGRSKGGLGTKLHVATDSLGNPASLLASPGQRGEVLFGATLIEGIACRFVIADRAYDAEHFHDTILEAGAEPVIPPRPNRRRPHAYDKDLYKERNLVERFFNKLKHFRRIATRYAPYTTVWLRASQCAELEDSRPKGSSMFSACHDALMGTLGRHFSLSKSRLQTLAVLIMGLAQSRTVNLTHLACHLPGDATHASGYRRLQRFFQFVRLETDRMALLVVHMLDLGRKKCLVLDRTNWKIGSSDVNILMLAIVTRRFRVPLLWSLIDHQGASNTDQRIALMRRYLALFPASSIELLLGDREFIGAQWMDFLNENNIPFAVRVREDMTVTLLDGKTWSLKTLMRRKPARGVPATWQGRLNGTHDATRQPLRFAAKRLPDGELLIVATNQQNPKQAFNDYRRRWGIECLFGDAKTRGLNLEDTRLRAAAKLDCLLVVVTLAITWAYRCATCSMGMKAIRRKTHGRREKSWFRVGLDALRRWIINDQQRAISAWIERAPKRPIRAP